MSTETLNGFSMSPTPKTALVIVAFNAESLIAQTLSRVPPAIWERIDAAFVVDDCSTDETVRHALALTKDYPKLRVLRNPMNQRYGGNQKAAFQHVINEAYDCVALLHADGQYAPERLPQMLEPLWENRADLVLGSRMVHRGEALREGMPRFKYYGNVVLTRFQNRLSGMNLCEFHSGFRAYRVDFLRHIPFWDNTDDWHFDTEILLQGHARGVRIEEVSIPSYYGREIRRANGLLYAAQCVQTTLRYALHRKGVLYARNYDLNAVGVKYPSKFSDPYSSHTLLFQRLQRLSLRGKTVLELGVGDSALTRRLHDEGAIVDCVELDASAADGAAPFARHVWNESLAIASVERIKERYDVVIAADILEHLLYPEEILSKLKTCVKKGGLLLVSLPNVANVYVRLNLVLGRFPYHFKGLLDRTHLHFYTRKTAERLMTKTGWEIAARDCTSIPVVMVFPFLRRRGFGWLLHLWRGVTLLLPGLLCYQYLFEARNPNESDLL